MKAGCLRIPFLRALNYVIYTMNTMFCYALDKRNMDTDRKDNE
jgi:hypothetical protein